MILQHSAHINLILLLFDYSKILILFTKYSGYFLECEIESLAKVTFVPKNLNLSSYFTPNLNKSEKRNGSHFIPIKILICH